MPLEKDAFARRVSREGYRKMPCPELKEARQLGTEQGALESATQSLGVPELH